MTADQPDERLAARARRGPTPARRAEARRTAGASNATAIVRNTAGPGGVCASVTSAGGDRQADEQGDERLELRDARPETWRTRTDRTRRRRERDKAGRHSHAQRPRQPRKFDAGQRRRDGREHDGGHGRQPPDGAADDGDEDEGAEDAGNRHVGRLALCRADGLGVDRAVAPIALLIIQNGFEADAARGSPATARRSPRSPRRRSATAGSC